MIRHATPPIVQIECPPDECTETSDYFKWLGRKLLEESDGLGGTLDVRLKTPAIPTEFRHMQDGEPWRVQADRVRAIEPLSGGGRWWKVRFHVERE